MASDRGAFIWYELMTTDRESAADFYREVVGWTFAQESTAPPPPPDPTGWGNLKKWSPHRASIR